MGPDILHTHKSGPIFGTRQGHHPDALLLGTIWWWPSSERVSFYWAGEGAGRWSHQEAGQWRRQPYTLPSWQSPSPSPVGQAGISLECKKGQLKPKLPGKTLRRGSSSTKICLKNLNQLRISTFILSAHPTSRERYFESIQMQNLSKRLQILQNCPNLGPNCREYL